MAKKNKSFVQIKEKKKKDEESKIEFEKKYEYIEPEKKLPYKKIIFIFSIILSIILIVILLKIIDTKNSKQIEKIENENKITTTTTTTTQNETEKITETLTCSTTTKEDNIQVDTQVIAYFHDKKLRTDENILTIKLLDDSSKEKYDDYVTVLQMFSIYLAENDSYEITNYNNDDEYGLSIKTTYEKDKEYEGNFKYDDDYDTVKQNLINLGHTCK